MDRFYRASNVLMVQGTSSGAGKSTLVAALCRILAKRGVRVAPFKPQNMSLNSAVAADGGEIGRAQALQAIAARTEPLTDMNPVLIKPTSDTSAQLVLCGKVLADFAARDFPTLKSKVFKDVLAAFERLRARFDTIVVEGAGSPAEVNLREGDIANMGFAEAVDCPVILVADIDRGGVFAHLLGTLECLSESERARIAGFVINRFRGERRLLDPAIEWLEQRTGKRVLGVLDFLPGLALEEEDAIPVNRKNGGFAVVVPVYPRISNHTDFDALRGEEGVEVRFVGPHDALPPADLIILPGSKNVRGDLAHLREAGWEAAIRRHLRYGGKVIGLCGGMQMLGRAIHDPRGLEGAPGSTRGLGLLDFETTLEPEKQLRNVAGQILGAEFAGYEIHMGVSSGPAIEAGNAAVVSADGQVLATYVHGVFDRATARRALLAWSGFDSAGGVDLDQRREESLERLARHVEERLDLEGMVLPS